MGWKAGLIAAFLGLASLAPVAAQDGGRRVALISDIHFSPFDDARLARTLSTSGTDSWAELLNTRGEAALATYGSDSNYALFASSLDAFARAAGDADFVVLPGDLLAHRFNEHAAAALGTGPDSDAVHAFAADTSRFVLDSVRAAVPGKPVVFALGNEDAACGDYAIEPRGRYLDRIRDTVRGAAGHGLVFDNFDLTWRHGGWYALHHPSLDDVRILVLNTVLWSQKYQNRCGDGGTTAGEAQLDWLRTELEDAVRFGQRIWLVYHIPAGIDAFSSRHADRTCPGAPVAFLRPEYEAALTALWREHADIIAATINGHTHRDGYRLVRGADGAPVTVAKIVPSISPVFGNNPGFQRATYGDDGALRDLETWRLDLAATAPAWAREYDFRTAYREGYAPQTVAAIARAAQTAPEGSEAELFTHYYALGHDTPAGAGLRSVACAIDILDPAAFRQCFCTGEAAAEAPSQGERITPPGAAQEGGPTGTIQVIRPSGTETVTVPAQ